jgi:NAD(P)-dependent dehydrogenase (short-subunit alcohol dehydrogenase family)
MRILVVGATGDIGSAVATAFEEAGHEVIRASRRIAPPGLRVDLGDQATIAALFDRVGRVDGVVSCAGEARWGALSTLSDDDFAWSFANKVMGQVNLVRLGVDHVSDGGVFLLTAGIFGTAPPPGVPALAMVNGALESFARAAALDLPRGIRILTMSPPWLHETAAKAGKIGGISAKDNAAFYVAAATGNDTGKVVFPA